jgi:hypothetical protein
MPLSEKDAESDPASQPSLLALPSEADVAQEIGQYVDPRCDPRMARTAFDASSANDC